MASWNDAVKSAQRFFAAPEFKKAMTRVCTGRSRIVNSLGAPAFDFDRNGWSAFYTIAPLGKLGMRYRDKVWKQQKRLKKGLRLLVAEEDIALPRVLNSKGDLHVVGAGLNTISKKFLPPLRLISGLFTIPA